MKQRFGLLGRKLSHSLSPQIHALFGDYSYELFEREPDELNAFFADTSLTGFNVTIPYKLEALRRCDALSETAQRIGAVNTVIRRADGTLFGDNTDAFGFSFMAAQCGVSFEGKKVLILGTGGASRTVQTAAADGGAKEIVLISRSGENNYQNLSCHADADVLVNTTPVGMFPCCRHRHSAFPTPTVWRCSWRRENAAPSCFWVSRSMTASFRAPQKRCCKINQIWCSSVCPAAENPPLPRCSENGSAERYWIRMQKWKRRQEKASRRSLPSKAKLPFETRRPPRVKRSASNSAQSSPQAAARSCANGTAMRCGKTA